MTLVTVPDCYEVEVQKQEVANSANKWSNTYTIKASTAGRVPTASDQIFTDIIAFEVGLLCTDAMVLALFCRAKVFGKTVGTVTLPIFTIPVNQVGNNTAAPISAPTPVDPVGGEVVLRAKKTWADGSRPRYNMYRDVFHKPELGAEPGAKWFQKSGGTPTVAGFASLVAATLARDIESGGTPPQNVFVLVHAHHDKTTNVWTVLGTTFLTTISHGGISTNKRNRRNPK